MKEKTGGIKIGEISRDLPILLLLGYLSIYDLKKREVPNIGVLALFLYSLFVLSLRELWLNLPTAVIVFTALLVIALVTNESIGGGDIKLISALALYMGQDLFLLSLPMAILIIVTLVWALITKKGLRYEMPFVPYIFLSYLVYLGVYV